MAFHWRVDDGLTLNFVIFPGDPDRYCWVCFFRVGGGGSGPPCTLSGSANVKGKWKLIKRCNHFDFIPTYIHDTFTIGNIDLNFKTCICFFSYPDITDRWFYCSSKQTPVCRFLTIPISKARFSVQINSLHAGIFAWSFVVYRFIF